jgi:RNA polymerase sigma factor (TIGR02999 family)
MPAFQAEKITQLLIAWREGDKQALDKLIPIVYEELYRLAKFYMRQERPDHTLQATALVNEAYLRLTNYKRMQWQDRAHFFRVAAQVMRRILVDQARRRRYGKRGGGAQKVSLDETALVTKEGSTDLIALDKALTKLASVAPRQAQIVELRYFGGLSVQETAAVIGVSEITVMREWRSAKAKLHHAISKGEQDEA